MDETQGERPASLLPYDDWTETALRQVMRQAMTYVAGHGLPGDHHFYVTFRTDHPDTVIPKRMRAQYPQDMTIVIQHQYWDLKVDEAADAFSIGLSFGGVPTSIYIPFAAVTGFADPHVSFGLQFRPLMPPDVKAEPPAPEPAPPPAEAPDGAEAAEKPQVVSLDAFRRRTTPKE